MAAGSRSRSSAKDTLKPRRAIRRFDIFAEYNRLERLDKGMDEPPPTAMDCGWLKSSRDGMRRAIPPFHATVPRRCITSC